MTTPLNSSSVTPVLQQFLQDYRHQIPELLTIESQLSERLSQERSQKHSDVIALYDAIYPLVEKELWSTQSFDDCLHSYQRLFREQESLLALAEVDERHEFILSIPIADRPAHLRGCLESIFQLCQLYAYGGQEQGSFSKVTVVIVEDSKEQVHIEQDIQLAQEYTEKGLVVHHYGLQEQYDLMMTIPEVARQSVSSIIGEPSVENFYHKGQAVTRNLSYLKALQLTSLKGDPQDENVLYYFVDSDQQFRINRTTEKGDEYVYALNYFYYINRVFCEHKIAMLTGKLICDPPVSPSVMSGNFLDDLLAFFQQLASYDAHENCQFHPQDKVKPHDAAYHDMAQLFGLKRDIDTYDYCCTLSNELKNEHNNIDCLKNFSQRINYFFFGEHLTRKTYFTYVTPQMKTLPARTIYPGNYICNFEGLKYIIPFGELRLRMSGPTAGRLIQSEIGERFASINLPMLHARTLQADFKDEYRPGVAENDELIDLTDEFERQFFGDLMLFTVVRLSKENRAIEDYDAELLRQAFSCVEIELLALYEQKHQNVLNKCQELRDLVNDKKYWWKQSTQLSDSIEQVNTFIKSMQHNFSIESQAYKNIQSAEARQIRIQQMIDVLLSYRKDRDAWDKMISEFSSY
ncbi:hypothetical protein [sulfur-oxidizing endosymbiont of Gigantopelta aegis]|uniref:hypothetical protein n=1 Tax=sulfur-oxidizing endosymbiont of Gigantopelta aegis TaxID=2794934 RepID=UPI001FED0E90|nr:hypothetical protein [sulfur-oxidizing endosymbiont of Gigantopelta aegis]